MSRKVMEEASDDLRSAVKKFSTKYQDLPEVAKVVSALEKAEKAFAVKLAAMTKADTVSLKNAVAAAKKGVRNFLKYADDLALEGVEKKEKDMQALVFARVGQKMGNFVFDRLVYPDAIGSDMLNGYVGFAWQRIELSLGSDKVSFLICAGERLSMKDGVLKGEGEVKLLVVKNERAGFDDLYKWTFGEGSDAVESVSKAIVEKCLIGAKMNKVAKKIEDATVKLTSMAERVLPDGSFKISTTEKQIVIRLEHERRLESIGRGDVMQEDIAAYPSSYIQALADSAAKLAGCQVAAKASFYHIDWYDGCNTYYYPTYLIEGSEVRTSHHESNATPKDWGFIVSIKIAVDATVAKDEAKMAKLKTILSAASSLYSCDPDRGSGRTRRRW